VNLFYFNSPHFVPASILHPAVNEVDGPAICVLH